MMEETRASLEEEHQKTMAEIGAQHRSIKANEEDRLQQEEAMRTMEKESDEDLTAKKANLQQQHQQQLEKLNVELKEKVANLQQSHQQQQVEQREEFANKLEQLKTQLEKVYINSNSAFSLLVLTRTIILS